MFNSIGDFFSSVVAGKMPSAGSAAVVLVVAAAVAIAAKMVFGSSKGAPSKPAVAVMAKVEPLTLEQGLDQWQELVTQGKRPEALFNVYKKQVSDLRERCKKHARSSHLILDKFEGNVREIETSFRGKSSQLLLLELIKRDLQRMSMETTWRSSNAARITKVTAEHILATDRLQSGVDFKALRDRVAALQSRVKSLIKQVTLTLEEGLDVWQRSGPAEVNLQETIATYREGVRALRDNCKRYEEGSRQTLDRFNQFLNRIMANGCDRSQVDIFGLRKRLSGIRSNMQPYLHAGERVAKEIAAHLPKDGAHVVQSGLDFSLLGKRVEIFDRRLLSLMVKKGYSGGEPGHWHTY